MTDLPYAADAEAPLLAEELNVLRRQYERESAGDVTTQTKFNYAWGLIKSRKSTDQQIGVNLLKEISQEIPERRRECLYYLALGNYKLGEYSEARKYNNKLIEMEPRNLQAQNLKDLIEQKLQKDGMTGMMIFMSGVVAVGALVVSSFYKSKNR